MSSAGTGGEVGRDDFAIQVHDALTRLYDPVYLQAHPLSQLVGEEQGIDRAQPGQVLRQCLIEAIDRLRPNVDEATNPGAWRGYHILRLRYVDGLDVEDVQRRLTVSKSTYYRASQQALQAVTSVLRAGWLAGSVSAPRQSVESAGVIPEGRRATGNHAASSRQLPIPLTSFLGRDRELATVLCVLGSSRLVTLTGAPGTGKTRLALEVAARVSDAREGRIVFVPLASVAAPELIMPAIAQAMGGHPRGGQSTIDTLVEDLDDQRLLLILDNLEQIVSAAPVLVDLLTRCPNLKILATSRVRLHVRGEREVAVSPLELPTVSVIGGTRQVQLGGRRLVDYSAIALFVERARDTVPYFEVTDETAGVVAEICHRLDGLPLAIELAAARMKLLPPSLLLTRLQRRLPLLVGGPRDLPTRQRTLRSAIAWSYDLLDSGDQKLLRQLAVFAGSASLEAVQVVCADDDHKQSEEARQERGDSARTDSAELSVQGDSSHPRPLVSTHDVFDRLESLVSQSLVIQSTIEAFPIETELRFSLLETIREYAIERLIESGERDVMRLRHARYFLSLAEQAEPHVASPRRGVWVKRLESENANLEQAMEWWISQGDVAQGLRMAGALVWFWALRGHLETGRHHVSVLLAAPVLAESTPDRAHALQIAATLAHHQRDFAAARALQADSLQILRDLGDQEGLVTALSVLGNIDLQIGDYAASREAFQRILAICQDRQDFPGMAYALSSLGNIAQEERDYPTARSLHDKCLDVCREMQFNTGIAIQLHHLALIAEAERDFVAARALYEQSLAAWQADDDGYGAARALLRLGCTATAQGDDPAAGAYLTRALTLMRHMHDDDGIALALEQFARLAAVEQQPARALKLAGAASALRQRIGIRLPPNVAAELEAVLAASRKQLGDAAALTLSEGESLTLEQAIALATSLL
ncbi:MAG: ATP-binding protein [Chloroflexota bacterium]